MPVRAGWIAAFTLANLGLWTGHYAPLSVLLPVRLQQVAPDTKEVAFALVSGAGAVAAMVAGPVAGALSDRTHGRWGRRHPWTLGGAALAAVALFFLAGHQTTAGTLVGWCLAQVGLNTMQAGLTAELADRVPVRQRATVAGWIGITAGSALLPVFLVTRVVPGAGEGFVVTGAAVLACAVVFVLLTLRSSARAVPLPLTPAPPAAHHRGDFAWAWASRALFFTGWSLATVYVLYYLVDRVGYERRFPGRTGADGVLEISVVFTAVLIVAALLSGVVSDRTGRRRNLATLGCAVVTAGIAMWALWPSWPAVLAGTALLAVGHGAFLAVDQALVTQVLPAAHRARDLGFVNISYTGPQTLAPLLAGLIVTAPGGYTALFAVAAVMTLLAGLTVRRVRGVA